MRQPSIAEQFCFVAFFATLPIYAPNLVFSPNLPGFDLAVSFLSSALASATVVGIIVVLVAIKTKNADSLFAPTPARTIIVAVFYLAALSLLITGLLLPKPAIAALSCIGGVLCGAATLLLCIAWGNILSAYTFREALIRLSVLVAICALINTVLSHMNPHKGLTTFILLSVFGVIPPIVRAVRGEMGNQSHEKPDNKDRDTSVYQSFISVAIAPFVGLLLFALTMAMRKVTLFDSFSAENVGAVLAVAAVLPVCFNKSDKPLLPFVFQVYLPVFAAVLLFLISFPTGGVVHGIGVLGVYVFFALIGVLALASFCAIAHAQEFSVPLIVGSLIAAFCLVSSFGLQLTSLGGIAENREIGLLILATAYFIYLVVAPGIRAWKTMFLPTQHAGEPALLSETEMRCNHVADMGELSKREREVLLFLGRGYSPAYVAKKMFLSDSTVRSHIKSIYRKLDIHSREELLQLIEVGGR